MTRFFFFLSFCQTIAFLCLGEPSLTRGWVCNLQCNLSVVRVAEDSLLSHLRLLGSLSVTSYGLQGLWWKYSYPSPHRDQTAYKNLVHTSQQTHDVSATEPSQLMLFREVICLLSFLPTCLILSIVSKIHNF
jgi:hypothetical protein